MKFKILTLSILLTACVAPTPPAATQTPTSSTKPTTTTAQGADAFAPEQGTGLTEQKLVHAKRFMVASANPLATQAGYEILQKGGNAMDAMVAIQTTLSLVEPQSSGLGGGAFVVYWDNKAKKLTTFDARETAPAAATPELFLDSTGQPMKFMTAVVGGRSVGVPAVPRMMEDLHKRYGRLQWADLFVKPIELAEQGFSVSPRMAKSIEQNLETLKRYPVTAAYFLPNGVPLKSGSLLKNPAFASSVRTLAREGAAPFYNGSHAQSIVNAVKNNDNAGLLTMADMKNYRLIEREPVCADYRVYQVCGMGAPSSGGIAVGQIVGMLNEFSPHQLPKNDVQSWRVLGDASRLAFADREQYVGDPDFVNVPSKQLLDKQYLHQRAAMLQLSKQSLPTVSAGDLDNTYAAAASSWELPSTSHISIVDADGNVLSMTTSIENAFGSGVMANGYLLNNELTDFTFTPTKDGKPVANRVEGGKRPRSAMAPTIVLKNGQPYLAVGSPGGSRIIGYVAKTLLAHIDWGMDIQAAIAAPNMLNRFGAYELEQNTSAANLVEPLQQLGFKTEVRDLNSGVQGIVITPTGLIGGADPRREGKVMGE